MSDTLRLPRTPVRAVRADPQGSRDTYTIDALAAAARITWIDAIFSPSGTGCDAWDLHQCAACVPIRNPHDTFRDHLHLRVGNKRPRRT